MVLQDSENFIDASLIMKNVKKQIINSFTIRLENFSLQKDKLLLRDLFLSYPLIILTKNNSFSLENLKNIAKVFGKVYSYSSKNSLNQLKYLRKYHVDKKLEVIRVSNTVDKDGKPNGTLNNTFINWHADLGHTNASFQGSLLYNKKNGHKAITSFCHTPDLLSFITRQDYLKLKESSGYHTLNNRLYRLNPSDYKVLVNFKRHKASESNQPVSKPMIVTTIRKNEALYLSPSTLRYVDNGLDFHKYIKLIDRLKYYAHVWKPHDVLIYDNQSLLHKRQSFTGERILYRVNFNYDNLKLMH